MRRPLPLRPHPARPTITQMTGYLKRKGWRQVDDGNRNALVFHGPNDIYGKPLVIVLPARSSLIDARRRIDDALRSLATLEATSPEEMARTIILRMARVRPAAGTARFATAAVPKAVRS